MDHGRDHGVPYVVEAGTALQLLDGDVSELATPQPWEARVWVAADHERPAAEIFETLTAEWKAERGKQITQRYVE